MGFDRLESRELLSTSAVSLGDFDGDGKTDQAIYDQSAAAFYVRLSASGGPAALDGGQPIYMGDPSHVNVPAVADFDGDGKADLAIYDETAGAFYIRYSDSNYMTAANGGQPIYMGNPKHVNVPVVGDFDGDGKADLAIYDETADAFYVRYSDSNYTTAMNGGQPVYMGNPAHDNIPVAGDFDGDGETDLAIYDETAAAFYARFSSTGYSVALANGQPDYLGDPQHVNIPVAGDFDGDGLTDLAIYDETAGAFYARFSSTGYSVALANGQPDYMGSPYQADAPVVGDFDGDGLTDLAIYDEDTSSLYARLSKTGYATALKRGQAVQMGDPTHRNIDVDSPNDNPGGSLLY